MNTVKRKKDSNQKNDSKDDRTVKKRIKKVPPKSNDSNFVMSSISVLISACLLGYAYFVLLTNNDLVPFNNDLNKPYFKSEEIDNRKWGTFRSGHYFGLKTLAQHSLVFGLVWFENRIIENDIKIRHWCDQSDKLTKYGWLKHDFHSFGKQQILDHDLNITTLFLIDDVDMELNAKKSTRWRARVQIEFNDQIKNQLKKNKSLVFKRDLALLPYFALDSLQDSNEQLFIQEDSIQSTDDQTVFQFKGKTKVFSNGFTATIKAKTKDLVYSSGLNSTIDPPLLHVKETIKQNLFFVAYPGEEMNKNKFLIIVKENPKSKQQNKARTNTNLAFQQLTIKVPSIVDIEFNEIEDKSNEDDFDILFNRKEKEFDLEFEKRFNLEAKNYSDDMIMFAKSALSNMIGSVGSFNGYSKVNLVEDSKIKKKDIIEINKYGPLKLLTAVPSRSFFPRGFLWDEGFHQLLLSKFDRNLSKLIFSSWFNLMNKNGWIPREVILGNEAEERVPNEFVVQNVNVANPPTFFLLIDSILDHQTEDDKEYFNRMYDKLTVWYDWFNKSQIGYKPGSYRWRGRNPKIQTELNVKTLSSGLDDYPRASRPTDQELHLDLFSWMTYATSVMTRLSKFLNHSNYKRFDDYLNWLTNDHLDNLHWSDEYQMYCDYGLHSQKVVLTTTRKDNQFVNVVKKELEPAKYGCVNEFGYVSLFPLILQLIKPSNQHLGTVLNKLRDENLLWSPFGLRSLSRNSTYYNKRNTEHDPPYWRGSVWLNINYLALKSLDYYSKQEGPFKERAKVIYGELKMNLINNVYNQYKARNYLFENYDDQTGYGKGCYPFTGKLKIYF